MVCLHFRIVSKLESELKNNGPHITSKTNSIPKPLSYKAKVNIHINEHSTGNVFKLFSMNCNVAYITQCQYNYIIYVNILYNVNKYWILCQNQRTQTILIATVNQLAVCELFTAIPCQCLHIADKRLSWMLFSDKVQISNKYFQSFKDFT